MQKENFGPCKQQLNFVPFFNSKNLTYTEGEFQYLNWAQINADKKALNLPPRDKY